ncbi:MAG: cytochrome c-type biosis protein CcmH [bacterium]
MRCALAAAAIALALAAAAVALAVAPATALAARASLVDVEDEVMCTTCNVPLNIADAPQAERERAFIRRLIDQGLDKQQIKAALVGEYGEDVLALPDTGGVGWTAYAIPVALLALLAGGLALLLPSWRRRSPQGIGDSTAVKLSDDDARRLDDDLGRYA